MTFNYQVSAIYLLPLIFFAVANPLLARDQIGRVPIIGGVSASGNLCCTSTGNCPGKPLSGALLSLNCNTSLGGSVLPLGQNTTDINGSFTIIVGSELGATLSQAGLCNCNITLQLPLNKTICSVLSTINGVITSVATPVGLQLTERFGLVVVVKIGPFTITVGGE